MLAALAGPDHAQAEYPLPPFRHIQDTFVLWRRFQRFGRANPDSKEGKSAAEKAQNIRREAREEHAQWFIRHQLRRISTRDGLRERLVAFWADHFTARGKNLLLSHANPAYVDETIRPHVAGRFADMLIACVTHPLMLHYLDQNASAGPNSRLARRNDRVRGLNENLAREVLELHTLGAGGPYTQQDVRELAELFTGLGATRDWGFKFRSAMAEPGGETVLGATYGAKPSMDHIRDVLTDLAHHPATAAHLARKICVHFVSDTPSKALVAHVTQAFLDTDGDLMACTATLLNHPDAWDTTAPNIRTPDEFVSASLRTLGIGADALEKLRLSDVRKHFFRPLRRMGQPWYAPGGPDGFDEADAAWITPQGISARMDWAMTVPSRLMQNLPDPRTFVDHALGGRVPKPVRFAAQAAENRAVAVGLILSSPAFQRR
ncbi:DUF1800 domain containing protein [Sulfitobacter noctilucae]|nr:DUF1800 domain containing protein [Sulfitobacter noctilucae]